MIHCTKCGKALQNTGDDFILSICSQCKVSYTQQSPVIKHKLMQGWQCPICGCVYSPFVTDEEIESEIWEEICLPLSQKDIDENSENYKTYRLVVDWVKYFRDKIKG